MGLLGAGAVTIWRDEISKLFSFIEVKMLRASPADGEIKGNTSTRQGDRADQDETQ